MPASSTPSRWLAIDCEMLERPWAALANRGLLEPLGDRMKATPLGYRFLDTVLASWPVAGA